VSKGKRGEEKDLGRLGSKGSNCDGAKERDSWQEVPLEKSVLVRKKNPWTKKNRKKEKKSGKELGKGAESRVQWS